jgi:hypothetical protein
MKTRKNALCLLPPIVALALLGMGCQQVLDDSGPADTTRAATDSTSGGVGGTVALPWTPYDYAVTTAKFATTIGDDGWPTATAWGTAVANPLPTSPDHLKNGAGNATLTTADGVTGTFKSLWDGPVLYFSVDVNDTTPSNSSIVDSGNGTYSATANAAGENFFRANQLSVATEADMWNPAYTPPYFDGVEFRFDLWNQKLDTDHSTSIFWISRSGSLAFSIVNEGIPTYGGVDLWEGSPEFTNRIKNWTAKARVGDNPATTAVETDYPLGYTVQVAIEIGGTAQENGMAVALDVCIGDSPSDEAERTSRAYWSHYDNTYTYNVATNQDMNRSLDWGSIVLDGGSGTAAFAKSDWLLRNYIRWIEAENKTPFDANNPPQYLPKNIASPPDGTVNPWTTLSWTALTNALNAGKTLLENDARTQAQIDTATIALEDALFGLIRSDAATKGFNGNPYDLKIQNTLPDPFTFVKDGKAVATKTEWAARRAEILDLAQYYEYGYIPNKPATVTGSVKHLEASLGPWAGYAPGFPTTASPEEQLAWMIEYVAANGDLWGFYLNPARDAFVATITVGTGDSAVSRDIPITISLPSNAQKTAAGKTGTVGIVLGAGDPDGEFLNKGYATVTVPDISVGDSRGNQIWASRSGTYYDFFPYTRNDLVGEASNERIFAWTTSRVIDALEDAVKNHVKYPDANGVDLATLIDPGKLAVTGFSINGKHAFAAGVFDERIGVTIPGSAGASANEPYRVGFVTGVRVYSWGVYTGGETINQTVRHNRVRQTEFFRRFLNPQNFYVYFGEEFKTPDDEGNLAIGGGTRLPYDKHELVASIWPRAIIEHNTVNDYNDGAEPDAISLQAAKVVARFLGPTTAADKNGAKNTGLTADDLIKFNYRNFFATGDPHGSDTAQYTREAEYLDFYFYGKALPTAGSTTGNGIALPTATATRLNWDPFEHDVLTAGGSNSYERHYGGLIGLAPWGDWE